MRSYNERVQDLASEYERLHPGEDYTARILTEWAVRGGKLAPRLQDQITLLSKDVGRALRTSHITDPDGRKIRSRHCLKISAQVDGKEVQMNLWQNIEFASPTFMRGSFSQRRNQAADDLWQLKMDADSYNKYYNRAADIQLEFDFREDMAERQFKLEYGEEEEAA